MGLIKGSVEIGGFTPTQLMSRLEQKGIMMNEYAEQLLMDERFTTAKKKHTVHTVELTGKDLGFPDGAVMPQILDRIKVRGLALCPIELGPHLRLAYFNQPEGVKDNPVQKRQAPSGSITVASERISLDDEFPKGFYLRNIEGNLWLRGYVADDLHVWNPNDHFIFMIAEDFT
ncbi:hypothetical protein [Jeotgalibaca sp. A122]|uniref:hypothetical protein n=1 Tax=Jeotgalibaca sp. A122 TaxID=3457322 RepID=UPI003FCF2882